SDSIAHLFPKPDQLFSNRQIGRARRQQRAGEGAGWLAANRSRQRLCGQPSGCPIDGFNPGVGVRLRRGLNSASGEAAATAATESSLCMARLRSLSTQYTRRQDRRPLRVRRPPESRICLKIQLTCFLTKKPFRNSMPGPLLPPPPPLPSPVAKPGLLSPAVSPAAPAEPDWPSLTPGWPGGAQVGLGKVQQYPLLIGRFALQTKSAKKFPQRCVQSVVAKVEQSGVLFANQSVEIVFTGQVLRYVNSSLSTGSGPVTIMSGLEASSMKARPLPSAFNSSSMSEGFGAIGCRLGGAAPCAGHCIKGATDNGSRLPATYTESQFPTKALSAIFQTIQLLGFRPLVAEPILEEESDYEAPEDSHSEPDAPSDSGPAAPSGDIGAAAPGPCDRRAASEPASGAGWHPVPPPLSARAHAPPPVAAVTPVAAAPQPLPTPVVETDGSWHLVVLSTALIAATAQQILSDLAGELSVFQLRDCLRRILGCVRGSSGGCCATLIGSGSCYSFIWFLNYYCFWRLRDLVTSGCGHCGCGGGNCWGSEGAQRESRLNCPRSFQNDPEAMPDTSAAIDQKKKTKKPQPPPAEQSKKKKRAASGDSSASDDSDSGSSSSGSSSDSSASSSSTSSSSSSSSSSSRSSSASSSSSAGGSSASPSSEKRRKRHGGTSAPAAAGKKEQQQQPSRKRRQSGGETAGDNGKTGDPAPPPPARVRVSQLSRNVSRAHVEEIFGTFGSVKSVDLPTENLHPECCKGFALIEFATAAEAAEAVKRLDGGQIDGQERRGRGGLLVQPAVAQVLLSGGRGVPALLADVQLLPALLVRVGEHPAVHLLAVRLQRAALGEGFAAVRAFVGPHACGWEGQRQGIRRTRKSARKYSKAPHGHPQVRISMPLIFCYKKHQKQQPQLFLETSPEAGRVAQPRAAAPPVEGVVEALAAVPAEEALQGRVALQVAVQQPLQGELLAAQPALEGVLSDLGACGRTIINHAKVLTVLQCNVILSESIRQRISNALAIVDKLRLHFNHRLSQWERLRHWRRRRHKGKLRPPADAAEAAKTGAEAAGVAQEMPKASEAARETLKAAVAAAEAGLAMQPQSQPLSSRLARCRSSTDSPRMRLMPNFSCEASVAAPACCLWRCGAGSCCGVAPSRQEPLRSTGESRSLPVAMAESPLRPPPRAASRTVEWPAERRISCEISWEISREISSGVLAREPENGEL
uniref:RRM domain-containing protein n=1 Tax=Macrostomum lignano TaxID=282301 RepID=A0A1I8JMY3_9PLAT